MATLHMDVESVRAAQSKMLSEKEAMLGELTSLTGQINNTVGSTWIGNSATEFQQQYEQLSSQITTQLETLEELANALQNEITQWEEMSARMG
jgi:WXG100 family type VII secretion target